MLGDNQWCYCSLHQSPLYIKDCSDFTALESFSLIVRSFFDAPASTISIIIEMNPHSPIKSEQKDSTVGWLLRMMALSLLCHDSVSFVVHRSPRIVSRYTRSILLLASRDCGKPQSKGAGIPQQDASPNLPVLEYRKRLRIFVIQMFRKLWKGCEDILRWNISDNYIVDR